MRDTVCDRLSQAAGRTPEVRLSSLVDLHPAVTIAIHETAWGKRVLAVPPVTSERPTEHFS